MVLIRVTVELGFRVRILAFFHLAAKIVICFKFRLLNNGLYVFIIHFWGHLQAVVSESVCFWVGRALE